MDTAAQLPSAADLESRAGRVADPALPLKTKHEVACELREMVDSVRDAEASRVFPHMLSVLLDILRNTEPSMKKDTLEYQFRRVLVEIINRIPASEALRPHANKLAMTMLHILRTDTEDNAVTCVKTIVDMVRSLKVLTDEHVASFLKYFQELLGSVPELVNTYLCEGSPVLNPNDPFPGTKSFKVLIEAPIAVVLFSQAHRQIATPIITEIVPLATDVILIESPAQKKAREDSEAMGEYWTGMAPTITNPQLYADFINAQIKMSSFVAYIMKSQVEAFRQDGRGDEIALACIRMLQDCPSHSSSRRELLVVMRHLMNAPSRRAVVPHINKLLSEKVLLGQAVGSQEILRPFAYNVTGEFIHQIRAELSFTQLTRYAETYASLMHNPHMVLAGQLVAVRMFCPMVDMILTKESPDTVAALITFMAQTLAEKAAAIVAQAEYVVERIEKQKRGDTSPDISTIEKERPIANASYASEAPEDIMRDLRGLMKALVYGYRMLAAALKRIDRPITDGEISQLFFESAVRCLCVFELRDPAGDREFLDWMTGTLIDSDAHVFQELWTRKLDFFFNAVVKRAHLIHIMQILLTHEATSTALVSIVLRHFSDRLGELGEQEEQTAVTTIRIFKLAFSAVTTYPDTNEPVLARHLARFIMDSFPMAAKATHPTHYFHLIRALFRAIGSGAGRFELLYKEVLPLLPEMLESLNRQLMAADSLTKDLLVELCLTVPLRLTHLLPHLHYLMQPLVSALQGGPELVSQGLRTLELCIDNLTGEFLDPILKPVLRELMEALHSLLKPLPGSHHHAHTTIRILGKLGGRNRRLLDETPHLEYKDCSDTAATIAVSFSGRGEHVRIGPMARMAAKMLRGGNGNLGEGMAANAYQYLEQTLLVLMNETIQGHEREGLFVSGVEGMFDAIHILEVQEQAEKFLRSLSHHIFTLEARRSFAKDNGLRRFPSHLFGLYLDALPHALARPDEKQAGKAKEVVASIIYELVNIGHTNGLKPTDLLPTLHQIAARFSALCFEDSWVRKSAGCTGIKIMTNTPEIGERWTSAREIDVVRTLLHVLKDVPHDPPKNVQDIIDTLTHILRVTHKVEPLPDGPPEPTRQQKVPFLASIFFQELSSVHPVVRQASRTCIELLAELNDMRIYDLLRPHRDRVLSPIFTKPLRALPPPIMIGHVEIIRYCVSLTPPLCDLTDELLRLLHEALALADMDDAVLAQRPNVRAAAIEAVHLRVACIKLLTASMPMTDFFSKQNQTRPRITGVYFKSLYSSSAEVKDVAHEGLRTVLEHQNRLPKDLLQTGLRPILMNLADPKRLSIAGLEGLARLLKLLTNYFKVEIGSKLLDHFRIIADAEMLKKASRGPLCDNDEITKLVRLVNIFHLLPSAANVFLPELVNVVVQTEAQLHSTSASPFSEPLGKFLDRYPTESVDLFFRYVNMPRFVRTLRNILQADLAPLVLRELGARSHDIIEKCFHSNNSNSASYVLPGLLLCHDLATLIPNWTAANGEIIDTILSLWRSYAVQPMDNGGSTPAEYARIHKMMVKILIKAMEESPRIDILFEIVAAFSRPIAIDWSGLGRFLYQHVALNGSALFRRNILTRFVVWFDDKSYPWHYKTYFLRYIITPMILVHTMQRSDDEVLLDRYILAAFHEKIWKRLGDKSFKEAGDLLIIEILHLTTVMLHHCSQLLVDAKKDIIMYVWPFISNEDTVVKQTANLLAARFFEAFESPPKLILTAWTGLLKPPHAEVRTLVKQALDILASVLPVRMPKEPGHPHWAKTTRRLLAEEAHGMSQIQVIYQLIVRQPDLFYPCRDLFMPHMVNSLGKLGLQPTATPESRSLSLDVLSLIFGWEQKAINSGEPQIWVTPLAFRETMVSYLVRLATAMSDQNARNVLIPRALTLLKDFLSTPGWSDVSFKLDFFRKALDQNEFNAQTLGPAIASAKVLNVVCADKPDAWYTTNAKVLQKLVQTGMQTDETSLQDSLHPILDRLVRLFPLPQGDEEPQGEMADFHTFLINAITEGLRNMSALKGTLMILKSVVTVTPERIEPFAPTLMKIFNKYAKDHIAALAQPNQQAADTEVAVRWLISIIELCQMTPAFPADQRRMLYSTIQLLAEKSHSKELCEFLLKTAKELALKRKEPYPTMKEKAALLLKMTAFESRPDPLPKQYLEMIYEVYTDPTLRRSDLTARLEPAFLIGCRARDNVLREKFTDLLDSSIQRSLMNRLMYVLSVQSWDPISDANWIFLALDLILSSVDGEELWTSAPNVVFTQTASPLAEMIANSRVRNLMRPLRRLLFVDVQTAHETWVSVFSAIWSSLSRKEQVDVSHSLVVLLSKDYLIKQTDLRPNVVQTLVEGIHACSPPMSLPPHLLKYLAKTFGAWHVTMEYLQESLGQIRDDDGSIRDSIYDALAEVYAELSEEDMFYGLWRRRALHPDTNIGLAYEQIGMWQEAQVAYETAQVKLKNGVIPFTESEYCLWEDHWITAAEKLQQWDYLYELARQDGNQDLLLEAAWRNRDWSDKETKEFIEEQLQTQNDVATPRRRIYEAFLALIKLPGAVERNTEFTRILEDAMQLSLRKWVGLPNRMSTAHIQLLQHFQQFVELQEAVQIFGSLSVTNAQNLERKSSDLKLVLQAWRERLPNLHDDISVWSDLVAWRQNVFNAINRQYIPLISANAQGGQQANNSGTYGYRGYHETAWIINRFAHVARKHDLLDVAHASLIRIYQLPNIEISEAFLKLREEARCHLQVPEKLNEGLTLINNTNLTYFSNMQKAEFYTLKGMFYSSLGQNEEASDCFGQAVQLDMNLPKAWAEWGRFNDKIHKEANNLENAANAVSCYLQAAGLFKSAKSRPLLTRVLWLLSNDDSNYQVGRAFDTYQGDSALWYWITLIPQLILSLACREAKQARHILLALARHHPQALFFPLRTTKEDLVAIKQRHVAQGNASLNNGVPKTEDQAVPGTVATPSASGQQEAQQSTTPHTVKQDWEYVDEIVAILKTASPLLALTLETMVDQCSTKFKATPEEEIYRFTFMLLQDGLSTYCSRILNINDDGSLTEVISRNIGRLLHHLGGPARQDYEDDFIRSKPNLTEYIQRLQHWRGRYEKYLEARPRLQPLDLLSHWLMEFQYTRFDEVEVPGQYLEHVDSSAQFSRIRQFGPKFELCRGQGFYYKRFFIHGHDSTRHAFAIQQPVGRWIRREDRVMQLFRTFNQALTRRKESRKRNLHLHVPVCVAFSPQVRLVSNDASYISLQEIFEQHCDEMSIMREDPILRTVEKVKEVLRETQNTPTRMEYFTLKKSVIDEICAKMVPDDVLQRYMLKTMDGPSELWRMRKTFTTHLAANSFVTYALSITSRYPNRFHFSRSTGQMYMSELLPGFHNQFPVFASSESIPFRFTPNMQRFVTSIGMEGVLVPGIVAIARALTKPEFELDQHMCLFSRDEVNTWLTQKNRPRTVDTKLVQVNTDSVVSKAAQMACKTDRNQDANQAEKNVPVMQPVTQLVNNATNPLKTAVMVETFHPWF